MQAGQALRRIGIYGGSFDPVHHGHLILAREACERFDLEKIIFVPAAVSPFKKTPGASPADRVAMLRAAISGELKFEEDEIELHRPPPSYTIDTIEAIRGREAQTELFYLVGRDNVADLSKWHRFNELKSLVRFVVLDRTITSDAAATDIVDRKIDISATEIRNRVASGQSIRYLVPESVSEIIKSRRLYQEN